MVTVTREKLYTPKYLSQKITEMESELQKIKLSLPLRKSTNVVKKTGGILGKTFPSGLCFQKKIRDEWGKREKRLKIYTQKP